MIGGKVTTVLASDDAKFELVSKFSSAAVFCEERTEVNCVEL